MDPTPPDDPIEPYVEQEAARALLRGSLLLAIFGGLLFIVASWLWLSGRVPHWIVAVNPLSWALWGLLIRYLARRGLMLVRIVGI